MKRKSRKHKKAREVLGDIDLEMHKEAMRLETERRRDKEFSVV